LTNFAEFLQRRGLTVCGLARSSGIPKSQLSEWKNGRHLPSRYSVHRLAFALRIPPAELLREIETREKTESWPNPPAYCLVCHHRLFKLPNPDQFDVTRPVENSGVVA
jgi:transcriptional regulator with XRE-family HTH domain